MKRRKRTDQGALSNGRVTIRTVAADAGVSVAAVSKVLRHAYGVSQELRSRVQASVAKLGYRPRPAARAMRGQTFTIGVLLPDIRNPFFADILAGVNSALERTQYQMLLGISHLHTIEVAVADTMVDWQMDGVIMVAPRMTRIQVQGIAARVPTAIVGHHEPQATSFDTVNNDDRLGAMLVVRHLAEVGAKRIALLGLEVTDQDGIEVTTHREGGYRAAMAECGLAQQIVVARSDQTSRGVQVAARHLLQAKLPPEAIFCWTDFVALEVLSVARELGIAVPGDLAVVGYDNVSACDLKQNSLTSVDQSGQVLGLQAARLLIERIKGRATAEHFIVTPRIVVRGSSGSKES